MSGGLVRNTTLVWNGLPGAEVSPGGGIYSVNGGRIEGCIIRRNASEYGGGGVWLSASTMTNCFISENQGEDGGGVYATASSVLGCTISNNLAHGYTSEAYGGGVYIVGGEMSRCKIIANISGDDGGGYGGGVYCTNGTLRSCLIAENTANGGRYDSFHGGGIYLRGGIVINCTLPRNTCTPATINPIGQIGQGGGLYCEGGTVKNSIIYLNTAPMDANRFFVAGTVTYSCTTPAVAGVGNITSNPQFVNAAAGNYHLGIFSPCVDSGSNEPWMSTARDLDGNPRIINLIVDMGAYESRLRLPPWIVHHPRNQTARAGSRPTIGAEYVTTENYSPITSGGRLWDNGVSSYVVAQSFLARSVDLSSIDLYSSCSESGNIRVSITEDDGAGAPDLTRVLTEVSLTGCAASRYEWRNLNFPDITGLTIGQQYWILVYDTNGGLDPAVCSCYNAAVGYFDYPTDPFPDGRLLVSIDSMRSWEEHPNTDLLFRLYARTHYPAFFSVGLQCSPPWRYQWYFNNKAIPSATNATYLLSQISTDNAGTYHVVVSNANDDATSAPAVLTVLADPGFNAPKALRISRSGPDVIVMWTVPNVVLQEAENLNGPWSDVPPPAVSPFKAPRSQRPKFYRMAPMTNF